MEKNEFSKKVMKFYLTPAREIMIRDFSTIKRDEPIKKVMNEISKRSVNHLWVVDSDDRVVGIITEKDLLDSIKTPLLGEEIAWDILEMKSLLYKRIKNAGDIMTPRLFKCESDTDLKTIVNIMVNNRIRHFPVVDSDKLIGEININQIIKLISREFF